MSAAADRLNARLRERQARIREKTAIRYEKRGGKKCVKCGERKPIQQYGQNSGTADGYQTYCNACKGALAIKRRERNLVARIKHHTATRVATQLGAFCPEDITRNLAEYLGYRLAALVRALDDEVQARERISLRKALERGYHIDHIVPLSSFQVVRDGEVDWAAFRECWAISNLRAIAAEENLAKGSKFLDTMD